MKQKLSTLVAQARGGRVVRTAFLDGDEIDRRLLQDDDVRHKIAGGFPDARRVLLTLHPAHIPDVDAGVAVYRVTPEDAAPAWDVQDFAVQLRRLDLLEDQIGDVREDRGGAFLVAATGKAAQALAEFRGPGRRWQRVGELNGALVVDDYAHNATKVAAAVQAARQTGRRVRVVFQPHRYLRTQQSWPRLADALMNADDVYVLDIAAASEAPIPGIHATLITERMRANGHAGVGYRPDRAELLSELRRTAAAGDILVTMGAGDVWKLARELAGGAS